VADYVLLVDVVHLEDPVAATAGVASSLTEEARTHVGTPFTLFCPPPSPLFSSPLVSPSLFSLPPLPLSPLCPLCLVFTYLRPRYIESDELDTDRAPPPSRYWLDPASSWMFNVEAASRERAVEDALRRAPTRLLGEEDVASASAAHGGRTELADLTPSLARGQPRQHRPPTIGLLTAGMLAFVFFLCLVVHLLVSLTL